MQGFIQDLVIGEVRGRGGSGGGHHRKAVVRMVD